MKKFMKILVAAVCIMSLAVPTVFAELSLGDGNKGNPQAISGANGAVGIVLGAIQWIGYAISIGMLAYIGIKYIMASVDEKANLKNSLIRYVIGAVLIAAGVSIASWIFSSTI